MIERIKGRYAYICQCKKVVEIPEEHKDFFLGSDEQNKITILAGECPECGHITPLTRDALGKTVLPLYKGKFKVRWEE